MNGAMFRGWMPVLLAATVIFAALLLQPGGVLGTYDIERMHQCYKHDFRAALFAGEWPWWNPYTALGRPFFADIETAVLYPPTWLVLLVGVEAGILAIVWLHLVLAIEGTRRLSKLLGISCGFSLVAGIAFALSGALLSRIQSGQLHLFCVVCLWPWLWAAAIRVQDAPGRRSLVHAAWWLALAFLAGSPQILWCGLVPLPALLAGRSETLRKYVFTLGALLAAGALAAGLVAVQLLPFIELLQQGNRPLSDPTFATRHGQAGWDWLTLLLPPGPWLPTILEFNLHSGTLLFVGAIVAIGTGRKNRTVLALTATGIFSALLALGDQTPLLPILAESLPGFGSIRYPSRYALALALVIPLLACWWMANRSPDSRVSANLLAIGLGLQGVVMMAALFIQGQLYRTPATPRYEEQIRADLHVEGLPRDKAPSRAALPSSLLRANAGAQAGISTVTGFNNPGLFRTWHTAYILAGEAPPDFHRTDIPDRVISELQRHQAYFNLALTRSGPAGEVVFSVPPGPRAYLSAEAVTVSDWRSAATLIRDGHDFIKHPVLEQTMALANDGKAGKGQVEIVGFRRNRVSLVSRSDAPGMLVFGEAWYPGWHATVDGIRVEVMPANAWMRAIHVPGGSHAVEFFYRPRGLAVGAAVSLATLLLCAALWRHKP